MEKAPSQHDAGALKPTKRLRNQNYNENTSPKKPKISVDPLNLVDINDDCLEVIFKYLNLVSLVNVAESDERFIAVARLVYNRRYRSKLVFLNLLLNSFGYETKDDDDDDDPEIGKEIAEPFFRQFGHLVSSISFNFMAQHGINIEKALLKNCSDSLTFLELNCCQVNNFQTLTEPLEKVEELLINKSYLGPKLSKLNIWFPNLGTLQLSHVKLMQPEALQVNFPQLKHLAIFNEEQTIPQTTIGELLRFNPQLETLTLRCKLDVDFLQFIAEFTPQLENLALWAPTDRFESFGNQKISFESVKEFKLKSWFDCGEEFLVEVPFKFDKLQKLVLYRFNEFKGEILNFIKQNQDVTQLSLLPHIEEWDDLGFDGLKSIVESLPKLVELEFCGDMFTQTELIQLLSKYEHFKNLQIWFVELPKFRRFRRAAKKEWILTIHSVNMGCPKHLKPYFCMELERKI